jgi:glycosyltransferase involved in cell wall biosynthesis
MENKKLVLLTSSYPNYSGEYFLEDEIKILSEEFDEVLIFCFHQDGKKVNRKVPINIKVIDIPFYTSGMENLKSILFIFEKDVVCEIRNVFRFFKSARFSFLSYKILFVEYLKAQKVHTILKKHLKNEDFSKLVFYSYWHDYKALALIDFTNSKKVSRAHGWDVDFTRHQPAYLPFKKLIIDKLDKTFSISEFGVKNLIDRFSFKSSEKIIVSRLGKLNGRQPIFEKNKKEIIFCSCSNLIPLKRVELIIETLSKLNYLTIKWFHFGDGELKNDLQNLATKKLSDNAQYKFMGIVPNQNILDFYSENHIDFFINLSENEGIPVSIMEAQSAAIPVIATNVGGTSEIVNNENGFLIDKDFEVNKLVCLIEDFLELPSQIQKEKRLKSYQNWKNNYDAEKNYRMFSKILKEL